MCLKNKNRGTFGSCVWKAIKSVFMEIFLKEQQCLTLRTELAAVLIKGLYRWDPTGGIHRSVLRIRLRNSSKSQYLELKTFNKSETRREEEKRKAREWGERTSSGGRKAPPPTPCALLCLRGLRGLFQPGTLGPEQSGWGHRAGRGKGSLRRPRG